MCGSGAALRGQARRARGAHAPHTLRLSSSSMAPSARTWFPVCARPAQAAAPRTPSRAAPQPAAARKRLLPHTACSADARGPGPPESARKQHPRRQEKPGRGSRNRTPLEPGGGSEADLSVHVVCAPPRAAHVRARWGPGARARRRSRAGAAARARARQPYLGRRRAGRGAAPEIRFSADSSRSRAQGAESMVCSVWSVMLATKAMFSISLKKSARPPTYPTRTFTWSVGGTTAHSGGRTSRRPVVGATLVLTCRSPCRKSAGAHTRSALHPARGHIIASWQ